MKYASFEKMPVWLGAVCAAQIIYEITNGEKWAKEYSLKDQIRRAVCSISSNIAEGAEYDNLSDFIRFLRIAKGSLGEVKSQLFLADNLGFVSREDLDKALEIMADLGRQLGGFLKYLKQLKTAHVKN